MRMRTSKSMSRYHMTRRAFLGAGIAGAMIATVGTGLAQQPAPAPPVPRVKGPRVWLDMDQTELDAAYDQSVYAPNLQQVVKRWATNSEGGRARLGAPQVVRARSPARSVLPGRARRARPLGESIPGFAPPRFAGRLPGS